MAGGIWEAIGAALQQGVGTYHNVNQQQLENRRRDEALARERFMQDEMLRRQAEQDEMSRKRFDLDQQDRQRGILSSAIEGLSPDQVASPDLIGQIKQHAPELMGRFNVNPMQAGLNVQSGLPQHLGGAAAPKGPAATFTPETAQRRPTLQEQGQQFTLDKAKKDAALAEKVMAGLQAGTVKDTPANRALIAQFTQANPNEMWGSIEHPSRASGAGGGVGNSLGSLADAVIANPTLWETLTPTARTKLAPELSKRGFDFERSMTAGGTKWMAEAQAAIDGAEALRQLLEKDAGASSGPIKGYAGLLPDTDAMQTLFGARDVKMLQAALDLQRQRIGKLLEGGVLRKEDELKYAKILPTVTDSPQVQAEKMRLVQDTLQNDLAAFAEQQTVAGRRVTVPTRGGGQAPPAQSNTTPVRGTKVGRFIVEGG
jgi:hypothetical protein